MWSRLVVLAALFSVSPSTHRAWSAGPDDAVLRGLAERSEQPRVVVVQQAVGLLLTRMRGIVEKCDDQGCAGPMLDLRETLAIRGPLQFAGDGWGPDRPGTDWTMVFHMRPREGFEITVSRREADAGAVLVAQVQRDAFPRTVVGTLTWFASTGDATLDVGGSVIEDVGDKLVLQNMATPAVPTQWPLATGRWPARLPCRPAEVQVRMYGPSALAWSGPGDLGALPPLTCPEGVCVYQLAGLPRAMRVRPGSKDVSLSFDCDDADMGASLPVQSDREWAYLRLGAPGGPIAPDLPYERMGTLDEAAPPTLAEARTLVLQVLAAGRDAVESCRTAGHCAQVAGGVLDTGPTRDKHLTGGTTGGKPEWNPGETPRTKGWSVQFQTRRGTATLANQVWDHSVMGVLVRLEAGDSWATIGVDRGPGDDVQIRWPGGSVSLAARWTSRRLTVFGDAVTLGGTAGSEAPLEFVDGAGPKPASKPD